MTARQRVKSWATWFMETFNAKTLGALLLIVGSYVQTNTRVDKADQRVTAVADTVRTEGVRGRGRVTALAKTVDSLRIEMRAMKREMRRARPLGTVGSPAEVPADKDEEEPNLAVRIVSAPWRWLTGRKA